MDFLSSSQRFIKKQLKYQLGNIKLNTQGILLLPNSPTQIPWLTCCHCVQRFYLRNNVYCKHRVLVISFDSISKLYLPPHNSTILPHCSDKNQQQFMGQCLQTTGLVTATRTETTATRQNRQLSILALEPQSAVFLNTGFGSNEIMNAL